MAQANHVDVEALAGFAIVRVHRNGEIPRVYLRAFQIVGRDGLAHLGYGSRTAAHVFDSRSEDEDVVRRRRRRAAFGAYDYLVEEVVGQADTCPG